MSLDGVDSGPDPTAGLIAGTAYGTAGPRTGTGCPASRSLTDMHRPRLRLGRGRGIASGQVFGQTPCRVGVSKTGASKTGASKTGAMGRIQIPMGSGVSIECWCWCWCWPCSLPSVDATALSSACRCCQVAIASRSSSLLFADAVIVVAEASVSSSVDDKDDAAAGTDCGESAVPSCIIASRPNGGAHGRGNGNGRANG